MSRKYHWHGYHTKRNLNYLQRRESIHTLFTKIYTKGSKLQRITMFFSKPGVCIFHPCARAVHPVHSFAFSLLICKCGPVRFPIDLLYYCRRQWIQGPTCKPYLHVAFGSFANYLHSKSHGFYTILLLAILAIKSVSCF